MCSGGVARQAEDTTRKAGEEGRQHKDLYQQERHPYEQEYEHLHLYELLQGA